MSLEIPIFNVRFIDSLNFLPTALAKLPKMFDMTELSKGYFPHLLNKAENVDLVLDCLPDMSYYNADGMYPEDREKFTDWYYKNKQTKFIMKDELIKYCTSDVDILRRCCLKFRDLFLSISAQADGDCGVDPFQSCITIASACNLLFRRNFLQPESIALIPAHGYQQMQSVEAIKWLLYVSHTTGKAIKHARNGGEVTIGSYKLDGYYEDRGQKIAF